MNLKHRATIDNLMEYLGVYEPWMNQSDRDEALRVMARMMGKTPEMFDTEIEIGIANGYTPEEQLAVAKMFMPPRMISDAVGETENGRN